MQWNKLKAVDQLSSIDKESVEKKGVVIFKHSPRCMISSMALKRFQQEWEDSLNSFPLYYLDLIAHREVSQAVSSHYAVEHQSPQLLFIQNQSCSWHASHEAISVESLKTALHA